jgi:twitching motility protein PilT
MLDMRTLLEMTQECDASDLHLTIGSQPLVRINGDLRTLTSTQVLDRDLARDLIYSVLNDDQMSIFEEEKELDLSCSMPGLDRFRVNIHMQRGNVEAAFRRIPGRIPPMETLNLPPVVATFARKNNGLVLVTGATGMGKSTTMASMIDLINSERHSVVICIEDPIEFVHTNKMSIIKQREVYADTHSFSEALRRALRQDPDVIVVGEMRDLETIATALTAAETGHLVLGTLHTPDAPQTVERIIDAFPPHQQNQVRLQLADCLQGILSQMLLPRQDGKGRVLATEVIVSTPAVRNLIRERDVAKIPNVIQTGAQFGMRTMDQCLKELVEANLISYDLAISKAKNPEALKKWILGK